MPPDDERLAASPRIARRSHTYLLSFAARGYRPPPHLFGDRASLVTHRVRRLRPAPAQRHLTDAEQRLFVTIAGQLCRGREGQLLHAVAMRTLAFAVVELPRNRDPFGLAMAIRSCLAKHSHTQRAGPKTARNLATRFRVEELPDEAAVEAVRLALEEFRTGSVGD